MMRPTGLSPPCERCRPLPFASDALEVSGSCCPLTKSKDSGAGQPRWGQPAYILAVFLCNAIIFDAKQRFKFWFRIVNMP